MPEHDDLRYERLATALRRAGYTQPTMVIDKEALDSNIQAVNAITQRGFDYRIVAKSLPSVGLLRYVMNGTGSTRLMCFHLPFVLEAAHHFPECDILMGKPMTVHAADQVYEKLPHTTGAFDPEQQLQWLVDSEDRLEQYAQLAERRNRRMRISLEIDIGLHRGGFHDAQSFRRCLESIRSNKRLSLSGLMGYEAHISKIPAFLGGMPKALSAAEQAYSRCVAQVREVFGEEACETMVFNTGGSSTYPLYQKPYPANEISTASALVKPTDFDVPTLKHHRPAAFIATPVLKTIRNPNLPMAAGLSALLRTFGLLPRKACFIYGGNWLAKPVWPRGAQRDNSFGHSSNQEMYDLPNTADIAVDDFMFFRPTQSEAVFLQFGDIVLVDRDAVVETWPVFSQHVD